MMESNDTAKQIFTPASIPNTEGNLTQKWEQIRSAWLNPPTRNLPSSSTDVSPPKGLIRIPLPEPKPTKTYTNIARIEEIVNEYDQQSRKFNKNSLIHEHVFKLVMLAEKITDSQGKSFTRRIPLRQIVSVLYRSWFHDGTIPDRIQYLADQKVDKDDRNQPPD